MAHIMTRAAPTRKSSRARLCRLPHRRSWRTRLGVRRSPNRAPASRARGPCDPRGTPTHTGRQALINSTSYVATSSQEAEPRASVPPLAVPGTSQGVMEHELMANGETPAGDFAEDEVGIAIMVHSDPARLEHLPE